MMTRGWIFSGLMTGLLTIVLFLLNYADLNDQFLGLMEQIAWDWALPIAPDPKIGTLLVAPLVYGLCGGALALWFYVVMRAIHRLAFGGSDHAA
jgi:hypothetical protein